MEMITGLERDYIEKGDTWPKVLRYNYEKYGDTHRAMRHKHYGVWQSLTWKDYYLRVKQLALGLLSLDFEPEDKLLIIGDNAPEWYYAELACQSIHGTSVGLYSESNPSEIRYIAENSESRFAIAEDQEQVDKFLQIKDALPRLQKVIYWGYKGLAHYSDGLLMGYKQVIQLGKEYEEKNPGIFERNVEAGKADDVCAIVYTSGTTGDQPKGAVHSFKTMRVGAEYSLRLDPWFENDNVVPYLPPVWMTEQWFGIGCHLLSAGILNFAEAPETQERDTRETSPSIVIYGARVWESQAAMVQARILEADVIKRFAFRWLMPVGYKMADLQFKKQKSSLFRKILYSIADKALFKSVRKSLGLSNARICYSTGTTLSSDSLRFYHALNLSLKSIYGTTEGGALAGAANDEIRLETVGPAHNGIEIKTTDKGELIYRQPGIFIGYYKDPAMTSEVLKDGWFYSGDRGFIGKDGHIVLLDRVEDLIELSSGDTLAPQFIESRLRFSPYITDAWVLAGKSTDYVAAIIIIDFNNVSRWAGQRRVAFNTFAELSQAPEVYDLIRVDIDRINRDLPPGARVHKYVNLHKVFDPNDGELTRNRKLRRKFLKVRYNALIDAIYGEMEEAVIEDRFGHHNGRRGIKRATVQIKSV
jgi:long-chain acyl-CoA synthetase